MRMRTIWATVLIVVMIGQARTTNAQDKPTPKPASDEPARNPSLFLDSARVLLKWDEAAEPTKIVGPIYFIGTKGLGSFLIKGSEGCVVLNTGMPGSGPMIEASIRKLGVKPEDVKWILAGHAHVDHVGGHAYLKKVSGAKIAAIREEKDLLESGGKLDFHYGAFPNFAFEPVKVDAVFRDGDQLKLGDIAIKFRLTNGHTRGSTTYLINVREGETTYSVAFPDGTSVNPGYRVVHDPSYQGIADDFRRTFSVLESLKPDIWLTGHNDVYGLDVKMARAAKDGVKAWIDPEGYRKWVAVQRGKFEAAINRESASTVQTPASHRVLGADRGRLTIVDANGNVEWEMPLKSQAHDLHRLPNGNILTHTGAATVIEINPAKEIVWTYTSKPRSGYNGPIEVHAFQRLDDGLTMIAESGNRRIIEVNRAGEIVRSIDLKVEKPNAHRDTRIVRKLANGHYLVCQELDGAVHEYAFDGSIVWSYRLDLDNRPSTPGHGGHGTEVFGALRLDSGNTLIATGNGNRVIEVNPAGHIVWSIGHDELPGIELKWVTSLTQRPNGNLIFGNTHAGPKNPQLIEVTREKKVVWTLKDFKAFGNDLAAAVILD